MWAPAGVPVDVVDKLNAAVNAALQSPEMIASMKKLGFESRIGSSQDFRGFCRCGNSALDRGGESFRCEITVTSRLAI